MGSVPSQIQKQEDEKTSSNQSNGFCRRSARNSPSGITVWLALFQNHEDVLGTEAADILVRLAADNDKVGQIAVTNAANLVVHPHGLRAIDSPANQRFLGRVAEPLDEVVKVARIGSMLSPGEAVVC
jgi:hypothetical protein